MGRITGITLMTLGTVITGVPIDIESFHEREPEELSGPTNAELILRFLAENRDKAFTPSEIAEGSGVKRNSTGTVLSRLEDRDLVRHKGNYWTIGDLERVRETSRFHRALEGLNELYGAEDVEEWREHAME